MTVAAWTDDEWSAVESLLEHGWKWTERFTRAKANAYRVLLAGAEPAAVVTTLQVLARRGETWGPSAAEILTALEADTGRPTFDEAFAALFQRVNGRRAILALGSEEAAHAAADELHPYVGAFLRAQGYDRLRLVEFFDPDYGALRVKELREAYAVHVEACDERVRTGRALAAAGRARQIGPRRLDPLGLLEAAGMTSPARPALTEGGRTA